MHLGYNVSGFSRHRLEDAIAIVADVGFQAVALPLRPGALHPSEPEFPTRARRLGRLLEQRNLRCAIETNAPFAIDPWQRHEPTLVSPGLEARERRIDFLIGAIRLAADLGASVVSVWSGAGVDAAAPLVLWRRLRKSLDPILVEADRLGVAIALEPEPGMFIQTLALAERLLDVIRHPRLGLTVDVGHLWRQCEGDIPELLRQTAPRLRHARLSDAIVGFHDHRFFGEGEIEFAPIRATLRSIGYAGGAYVELPEYSDDAVRVAEASFAFLRDWAAPNPKAP